MTTVGRALVHHHNNHQLDPIAKAARSLTKRALMAPATTGRRKSPALRVDNRLLPRGYYCSIGPTTTTATALDMRLRASCCQQIIAVPWAAGAR